MSELPSVIEVVDLTSTEVVELVDTSAVDVIEITTPGMQGPGGYSAYQIAVANGYGGTSAQWLQLQRGFVILESGQTLPPTGTPDDTVVLVKL